MCVCQTQTVQGCAYLGCLDAEMDDVGCHTPNDCVDYHFRNLSKAEALLFYAFWHSAKSFSFNRLTTQLSVRPVSAYSIITN
jgi:hypothetical protein